MEEKDLPVLKWEFSRISKALTFKLGDEPEIVHFIRTGFTTGEASYHVIQEDGYEIKPDGKDFLMRSSEIMKKFNIDIDAEFMEKLSGRNMTDGELITLIEENLSEENDIHYVDMIALIQTVDYKYAKKLSGILAKYSKDKGITIMTSKQK